LSFAKFTILSFADYAGSAINYDLRHRNPTAVKEQFQAACRELKMLRSMISTISSSKSVAEIVKAENTKAGKED
jgi:hypothetical protein